MRSDVARDYLAALARYGFVEQRGTDSNLSYRAMPGLVELLSAAISVQRFSDLSRPVLEFAPHSGEERYGQEIYRLTTENLSDSQVAHLFGLSPERIRQIVKAHVARHGGSILVSAQQANLLRVVLLRAIGGPAVALQQASTGSDPQHKPETYLPYLQELDAYRRLLEAIGIQEPETQHPAEIDLAVHRPALTHALATEQARLKDHTLQDRAKVYWSLNLIEELLKADEHTRRA